MNTANPKGTSAERRCGEIACEHGELSPLISAAMMRHAEVTTLLVSHGANVNQANVTNGMTPLMWAAADGNTEIATLFLDHGANVNQARVTLGMTPLMYAAERKVYKPEEAKECEAMLKLLVSRGAKVNQTDELDRTALHHAAATADFNAQDHGASTLKVLLALGADKNIPDRMGLTACRVFFEDNALNRGRDDLEKLPGYYEMHELLCR